MTKEYYRRVRQILESELTGKNKFIAISAIAQPVLAYSFGILNWKEAEIQAIDRRTRKLLTINNLHHPKADIDRLYLSRQIGGRGLINIEQTYRLTIIGLSNYLTEKKNDWLLSTVKTQQETQNKITLIKKGQELTQKYIEKKTDKKNATKKL